MGLSELPRTTSARCVSLGAIFSFSFTSAFSESYLDPQEDCLVLLVLFSWTAVVCVADLSVKERGRESE